MQKINATVIGLGRIGTRHAQILHQHPDFEMVSIVDCEVSKKETAKNSFDANFYLSIEELPNASTKQEIVAICSPNGLHLKHCSIALNKGYHILCEKPFGLNSAESEAVIELAKEKNLSIFCVMQNRYSPPAKWIKQIVQENKLGKIYQIVVNCFWNRNKDYYENSNWKGTKALDGGILFTQFSHFVDTVYWLFGEINVAASFLKNLKLGSNIEFEDSGSFLFTTKDHSIGSFNFSITNHKENLESSLTILGEKGTVKIAGQYMEKVVHCQIENYQFEALENSAPANNYGNYKGSASNHENVYNQLSNYFNGKAYDLTSAAEGKAVVQIIESVYNLK